MLRTSRPNAIEHVTRRRYKQLFSAAMVSKSCRVLPRDERIQRVLAHAR
jgi:hypothetical protein